MAKRTVGVGAALAALLVGVPSGAQAQVVLDGCLRTVTPQILLFGERLSGDGSTLVGLRGAGEIVSVDTTSGELTSLVAPHGSAPWYAQTAVADVSANGMVVAYATNFGSVVPGDTNGSTDIFVLDRATGATERVSVASDGREGSAPTAVTTGSAASLSADGRYVAFSSQLAGLVDGDGDDSDVFVRDRVTGSTVLASVAPPGAPGNHAAALPSMSPSGRYVAFQATSATGVQRGMVFDRTTGTTRALADAQGPRMVSNTKAAFSSSKQLVAGDTDATFDLHLEHVGSGALELVAEAGTRSVYDVSADASMIVFNDHTILERATGRGYRPLADIQGPSSPGLISDDGERLVVMVSGSVAVTKTRRPVITTMGQVGVLQGESAPLAFAGEVAASDSITAGSGMSVSPLRTVANGYEVTLTAAGGTAPGTRPFVVSRAGACEISRAGRITVVADQPILSAIDRPDVWPGPTFTFELSGGGYSPRARVSAGDGVEVLSAVVSPDLWKITVQVRVSSNVAIGSRDLVVTNPSGRSARMAGGLRVLPSSPDTLPVAEVHLVDPAVVRPGERTEIAVVGSGFTEWAQVRTDPAITVHDVTVVDDELLVAEVTAPAAAALYDVAVYNPGDRGSGAPEALAVRDAVGEFHPLPPARILDTRAPGDSPIGPGEARRVQVAGLGGVPATGVAGVVVNVTAIAATASTYLTVYPSGSPRPNASNLNLAGGGTRPNLVMAKLGPDGAVAVYNDVGRTHVAVDVVGWYGAAGAGSGMAFVPLTPTRLLDSRGALGGRNGAPAGAGESVRLPVVPPGSPITAVALNVTVTESTSSTYVTAFPSGQARPGTSNLNVVPGQTVPNMAVVPVGTDGAIELYNFAGRAHLIVDLLGVYDDGTLPVLGQFVPLEPERLLDTRGTLGGAKGRPLAHHQTFPLAVGGVGAVPRGASAVVVNLTATAPTTPTYLTVWPTGEAQPTASTLNPMAGQTVANLAVVPLGPDGRIQIYNAVGFTHVLVDVLGYFT